MKNRSNEIAGSISTLIIGIFLVLWTENVTNLIFRLVGCIMIIYGLFNITTYYKSSEKQFVDVFLACFLITFGIILIIKPNIITEVISFVIGLYIVLSSIKNVSFALHNKNNNNYNTLLSLNIVCILIGILCIVGKLLIPNVFLHFFGAMLIVYSVINIIDIIIKSK